MSGSLPAVTGPELIKLLIKDGWEVRRRANHGISLSKRLDDGITIVTIVPTKPRSLPAGTLKAILKQTRLSRERLLELIRKEQYSFYLPIQRQLIQHPMQRFLPCHTCKPSSHVCRYTRVKIRSMRDANPPIPKIRRRAVPWRRRAEPLSPGKVA